MKANLPLLKVDISPYSYVKDMVHYPLVCLVGFSLTSLIYFIISIKKEYCSCRERKKKELLLEKELIKEEKLHKLLSEKENKSVEREQLVDTLPELGSHKHCLKRAVRNRIFRKKPFQEAKQEVELKVLNPKSLSKVERNGIPIGRCRNFCNEFHPFQKEYEALPEDVKRELARENSLFLGDKFSTDDKFEVIRNAKDIMCMRHLNRAKLKGLDVKRFLSFSGCISKPILDLINNVLYKPGKSPHIETTAAMLRYYLKKFHIDNIILPRREFWTTIDSEAALDTEDSKAENPIYNLLIEEGVNKLFITNLNGRYKYEELPYEALKDAIIDLAKIFCFIEIGDLAGGKEDHNQQDLRSMTVDLIKESSGYSVKTTYNTKLSYKSICRFDNLPIQRTIGADGKPSYKFVLVDLDVVRKPDHTTVEMLLRMFPNHKQIIIDTIQKTNPALFEGYDPNPRIREDRPRGPRRFASTKEELINNYRDNKEKDFIEDKFINK